MNKFELNKLYKKIKKAKSDTFNDYDYFTSIGGENYV
jgi:hypothetical protein